MTQTISFHEKRVEKEIKNAITKTAQDFNLPESFFEIVNIYEKEGHIYGAIKITDNYDDPIDYLDN